MTKSASWIAALGAGLLTSMNPAYPQAPPAPPLVASLPVTIVLVRVIGPWTLPDSRGISRIVAIADGTRMRLFVQWIADAPQGAALVDSREVSDVVQQSLVFGEVRVEASENDSSVFLDTLPKSDGLRDTYVLLVQGPGQFRFGPSTN